MTKNFEQQIDYISKNFSGVEIVNPIENDNFVVYVDKEKIIEFLSFLKDDQNLSFKTLVDVFGVDLLGKRDIRFDVIYNLLSYKLNSRITVKVRLNDGEKIHTASQIFLSANWAEREVFDMYGIVFNQHPDLRRILTDYDFEGYPLRKDFPLTGYKEVRYDDKQKKVIYEPVKLENEFRNFDFEMQWEGTKYNIKKND